MPDRIPRRVPRPVQLRPDHGSQIPHRDLQRARRRALRLPADVHRRPGQRERHGGVDAACGEEDAGVGEARVVCGGGVGEQDDVAGYGEGGAGEDEGGAAGGALGDCGEEDCEGCCEGVGGDGEELGGGGGVAEGGYYGGLFARGGVS